MAIKLNKHIEELERRLEEIKDDIYRYRQAALAGELFDPSEPDLPEHINLTFGFENSSADRNWSARNALEEIVSEKINHDIREIIEEAAYQAAITRQAIGKKYGLEDTPDAGSKKTAKGKTKS